jgi:hypothetical protein
MTSLLNGNTPTLHAEDSFRLVYNGTYGATDISEDGRKIRVEERDGPLPFNKFMWDGEDYLGGLEPGRAKLVPFDLVRLFFGDPRSVPGQFGRTESRKGRVGDIPPREQEIRRLSVLYGLYDTNTDLISQVVPNVTITTADDVEVFCPATDPEGTHIYGYAKDSAAVHDPATRFAQLEAEMRQVKMELQAREEKGIKNDGADVVEDGPPKK